MGFEEINLVIPCLEMAHDSGIDDLDAPQVASPRVFKTHFWRPHCPAGAGRYVFLVRDPLEAGPSFFHFMQGWFFDAGEASGAARGRLGASCFAVYCLALPCLATLLACRPAGGFWQHSGRRQAPVPTWCPPGAEGRVPTTPAAPAVRAGHDAAVPAGVLAGSRGAQRPDAERLPLAQHRLLVPAQAGAGQARGRGRGGAGKGGSGAAAAGGQPSRAAWWCQHSVPLAGGVLPDPAHPALPTHMPDPADATLGSCGCITRTFISTCPPPWP
jgi:hypothetical protein